MSDLTSIDAVASCVAAARENARQVRQHISGEMWERVNGVHLALNDPARRAAWAERPHGFFQTVREAAALFDAAINAGLARDEGWHFLQLGLFLERAAGRRVSSRARCARPARRPEPITRSTSSSSGLCLLRACDALELYRGDAGRSCSPDRIVRFLIADPLSPRSVRYALDQIAARTGRSRRGRAGAASDRAVAVPDVGARVGASAASTRSVHGVGDRGRMRSDSRHGASRPTSIIGALSAPMAARGAAWTTR